MKWCHVATTGVLLMITIQQCVVQGSSSSVAVDASGSVELSSMTPTSSSIEVSSSIEESTSIEVSSSIEESASIDLSSSVDASQSIEASVSIKESVSIEESASIEASLSIDSSSSVEQQSHAPRSSMPLSASSAGSFTPMPSPSPSPSMAASPMATERMSSSVLPHPQPPASLTTRGMSSHTPVPGPQMTASMTESASKTSSAMVHATSVAPPHATSLSPSATSSYIPQPPASQTPTGRPLTPVTTAKAKKFKFSFKITNMVCTTSIRENDASNKEYQQLTQKIITAVNNAYVTDQFYRGAKILYVYCGSVVPVVEITKSVNATSISATELKLVEDVVKTGNFAGYTVNSSSFSSTPSAAPLPTIYITMKLDLSIKQFCASKTDFKNSFTTFLVATSGFEMTKASQIVVFDNGCMQTSTNYKNSQPMFYVSASTTDASSPDNELTIRAFKLLRQFLHDGTTWRLSASFDKKVKSVEMGGRDKLVETELSEMTIVLIGMGSTFGLLLLIVIIVLIITTRRRKHDSERFEAVTIENDAYRQESQRRSQPHVNAGYDNEIVIDEHNYEYPLAPTPNGRVASNREKDSTVIANKGVYQELHSEPQKDEAPPQYQTLSAEEEAATNKVAVEPEDPGAYTEIIGTFEVEPKELTPTELAQRKDDDDHLRKEFQSLEYEMPKGDEYPRHVSEKNRLLNVLPRPETRVILSSIPDQPHSDYINANLVENMHGKKQFILTQAPLQKTVDDFWRMILEQNVHVVVMVTPLVQLGTEKCFQYWPADSIARKYGEIEVQLNKKELKPDFTVTSMTMKSKEEEREIVLYRYMTWPEDNIPEKSRSFVAFLLEAKKSNAAKGNRTLLVHCSDGVSMSAVSVAIATGIQSLQEKKAVDVYNIVKTLRKERAGAVQVFGQYKFIYQRCQTAAIKRSEGLSISIERNLNLEALYEYAVHLASGEDTFANQADMTSSM